MPANVAAAIDIAPVAGAREREPRDYAVARDAPGNVALAEWSYAGSGRPSATLRCSRLNSSINAQGSQLRGHDSSD
ncbi:MAG: hypothetical protein DLM58_12120 [Pseudonocardiales bacterium]|nr:MAG: hypothetical protein DLM58_12120 [Pseudonocardiales bacterium]